MITKVKWNEDTSSATFSIPENTFANEGVSNPNVTIEQLNRKQRRDKKFNRNKILKRKGWR